MNEFARRSQRAYNALQKDVPHKDINIRKRIRDFYDISMSWVDAKRMKINLSG